ncbi:hypothetical protein OJAV_G00145170 [Oryzias javanicus]|uniref:Uncharacterized protein n=1 Tax=Oryzias javanicus TaxID=123683 RepID=A0A437CNE8_ORYJA|nr:hypothetical protein OJAV_G00145170 [Oryzias javanicus]
MAEGTQRCERRWRFPPFLRWDETIRKRRDVCVTPCCGSAGQEQLLIPQRSAGVMSERAERKRLPQAPPLPPELLRFEVRVV